MKKNIIVKEIQQGRGLFAIEVNHSAAPKIKGSSHNERVANAIKDILRNTNNQVKGKP